MLRAKYDLPQSHFILFLQVRNFIRINTISVFPNMPQQTKLESLVSFDPAARGAISFIYNSLSTAIDTSLSHVKSAWEEDLGIKLTEEEWCEAQEAVHSSSVCARHRLIQFKVLHRLHFSKARLAKMYKNVNPSCDRCGLHSATLGHMFWSCPKLSIFWGSIFQTVKALWADSGSWAHYGRIRGVGGGYLTGWFEIHHYAICYNFNS